MTEHMELMIKKIPTTFSFGPYFLSLLCRFCFSKQFIYIKIYIDDRYKNDLYKNQENANLFT